MRMGRMGFFESCVALGVLSLSLGISAPGQAEESETFEFGKKFDRLLNLNHPYNVKFPSESRKLTGPQLADLLSPKDPRVISLFSDFVDLQAFEEFRTVPLNRRERQVGGEDDLAHQRGLQIVVNRGLIRPGTLILCDSGHDIPVAVQLLKNSQLRAQAVFYFPDKLTSNSGTYERLLAQGQDWAADIDSYHAINSRLGSPLVLFVGLEGHRRNYDDTFDYRIPWDRFPSPKQLRDFGIHRIIYMTEAHPDNLQVIDRVLDDVKEYLKSTGLPVEYLGVDCRRGQGC